jgi:hypothetical protein
MKTFLMIKSALASMVEPKAVRRSGRIECRPSGENLEPRALQSALVAGAVSLVSPSAAGSALAASVNPGPSFQVVYQNDIVDQINVENDVVHGS